MFVFFCSRKKKLSLETGWWNFKICLSKFHPDPWGKMIQNFTSICFKMGGHNHQLEMLVEIYVHYVFTHGCVKNYIVYISTRATTTTTTTTLLWLVPKQNKKTHRGCVATWQILPGLVAQLLPSWEDPTTFFGFGVWTTYGVWCEDGTQMPLEANSLK